MPQNAKGYCGPEIEWKKRSISELPEDRVKRETDCSSNNYAVSCVCVCVCVCVTRKKMPDEWQARQAILAILQVSSNKHNAKKITTRVRGLFHQSITAILTEEKKRREAVY